MFLFINSRPQLQENKGKGGCKDKNYKSSFLCVYGIDFIVKKHFAKCDAF